MLIKRVISILVVIFFAAAVAACGSGSSSTQPKNPEVNGKSEPIAATGKVGILLKDSPEEEIPGPPPVKLTSPPMSQVWVTVNKVSLKMAEDEKLTTTEGTVKSGEEGWLTVFEGTARYDLLSLQDNNAALMALAPVPADKAGNFSKARLELNTAEGQNCFYYSPDGKADDPLNPCTDSDAYRLDVPSGKIDIEFHPHIHIGQDTTQYIVFDFLPADSVKVNEADDGRNILRPEIHAYTMPEIMDAKGWNNMKVEKVEGFIDELNGCDDPNAADILVLSHKSDGWNMNINITDAVISINGSDSPATCNSLQPGQMVKVKIRLSSDGVIVADSVQVEEGK